MGAMTEEVDSICAHMTDLKSVTLGKREYHCGKIDQHEIVLVFSRWGKVAAASTVTSLINLFQIEALIFTGVAGAVSSELNIGDIVVSEKLYQHDVNAEPLMPKHEIPLTGITYFNAHSILASHAFSAATRSLATEAIALALKEFSPNPAKCVQGTIATGDQFISDPKKAQEILDDKPETMAIEMEGAAVAQVCEDYELPYVVIRTISDTADHRSTIDFPRFIKEVAGLYSKHIVLDILSSAVLSS